MSTLLTIAIPTYRDYRGLSMTVQGLGLHHGHDHEIVVLDNFGCKETEEFCKNNVDRYVLDNSRTGTCYAKDRAIMEASGRFVLVIDSHVLLGPGSLQALKAYLAARPLNCRDLHHGVLLHATGKIGGTELKPVWSSQLWGQWHDRTEGDISKLPKEPFEVWAHGCGVFCVERSMWPGYHPRALGFGGEEGSIQEQYRARGGKILTLPFLTWTHSFNHGSSNGAAETIKTEDRLRNYLLNLSGLPNSEQLWCDAILHFSRYLGMNTIKAICQEVLPKGLEITSSIEITK